MTKLKYALAGLTALGGLAMVSGTASAMPMSPITQTSNVENVRLVCDAYGRCWRRPNYYAPRYYAPRVYAPRYYGGYGYGHRRHGHRRW